MFFQVQAGYGGCSGYFPSAGETVEHGGVTVEGRGEERREARVVRRLYLGLGEGGGLK